MTNDGAVKFDKASLLAPGKINLFLRVTGRRPDGYHEIETLFLPLKDVYDVIEISFAGEPGISISSSSDGIPCDQNNLCWKAADMYSKAASVELSLKIHISKNIPVTAGMGGGSSDAAAVLLLLQRTYNKLSKDRLHEIASRLGADVPFFLNPVPSAGRGIGNILEPAAVNDSFSVVILAPQFPVSAAWAYNHLEKKAPSLSFEKLLKTAVDGTAEEIAGMIHNDLAFSLYRKFPVLEIFRRELIEAGAINAGITGSGPTLFGICRSMNDADSVKSEILKKYGSSVLCCCSRVLSDRHPATESIRVAGE